MRETIESLASSDQSIDRDELLECMWQLAYYPVARGAQVRKIKDQFYKAYGRNAVGGG